MIDLIRKAVLINPEKIREDDPVLNKEAEYLCKTNVDSYIEIALLRVKKEAAKLT